MEEEEEKPEIGLTCGLENFGVAAKFIFFDVLWIADDQITRFTESSRLIECIRRKVKFSTELPR